MYKEDQPQNYDPGKTYQYRILAVFFS